MVHVTTLGNILLVGIGTRGGSEDLKFQVQVQLFCRLPRKDFVKICCVLCIAPKFRLVLCSYCYLIVARYLHGGTNIGFYNGSQTTCLI